MSKTQALWERPGSVAEQFWRHGRADFPIYDMHGHMGPHNAIYFARCEAPVMDAHSARIACGGWLFPSFSPMGSMRNAAVHQIVEGCSNAAPYVAINPHYRKSSRKTWRCSTRPRHRPEDAVGIPQGEGDDRHEYAHPPMNGSCRC